MSERTAGDPAGRKVPPLSQMLAFREGVYQQFHRRADALFEMLDAVLARPAATAPAHLMLLPGFLRKWGSVYDALAAGHINTVGVEDLLSQHPLNGGEPVYAVDTSVWLKCDAETSPKRGYYHHHNRHSEGLPIVAGWSHQWLAQVSFRHDSWSAPLSAQRVEPTDNGRAAGCHPDPCVITALSAPWRGSHLRLRCGL